MRRALLITHPEVVIDPAVPVPHWGLSARGALRMTAFAASGAVRNVSAIVSSGETKAVEAAQILGAALGIAPTIETDLHENDRSATGYLPPPEFEATADLFFAHPHQSVRGWERAIDAQARSVRTASRLADAHGEGDLALVAHGAVGTLLLCHLYGRPIDRRYDTRSQGQYFAFDIDRGAMLHGWRRFEEQDEP